jgi:short-subunit dehydrogenase
VKTILKPLGEQVIVVTGATSGIGLAIVQRAFREGSAVVAVSRNEAALEALRDRLVSSGGRVTVCVADVADQAAVEHVAEAAIAAFGGFDSWINNAGIGTYGTLEQVPTTDHRRVFDVNYFGVLHGSLVAARHLRQRGGGAIVNIGSILGDRAIVEQGAYSATKHAVQSLTDTLRMELERDNAGVSVTLVKPAAVDTPFPEHARNFMDAPPRLPQPLYRPEIVADAVLFACAHPRRTIYAGGGGLLSVLMARAAPRLTDAVMEVVGKVVQQKQNDPGDPARRDNLYDPRADGLRGSRDVIARRTSLAVQAQKLPLLGLGAGVAVIGAAIAFGGVRLRRRQTASSKPRSVR